MIHDSFTFFSPEIHDSLFYVSASIPEWKYPDLDFTAALELLAGYRPHITLWSPKFECGHIPEHFISQVKLLFAESPNQ